MAGLMNQGMVASSRSGSVTFWAWMVSIAVHLTVFSVLGVVKFSRCEAQGELGPAPVAKISQIKRLAEVDPVIPKPKVVKSEPKIIASAAGQLAGITRKLVPADSVFEAAKPTSQNPEGFSFSERPSTLQSSSLSANSEVLPTKVEFFGSSTDGRKICYVVDCSGSMRGIFGQVRRKLKESIGTLQADQYFYIIFFGGDRLLEFGDGCLVRATQKARCDAYDFIDLIEPAGQTNALAALERAVQIRDGAGVNPSVIYFFTDGFELTTEDEREFSQKIANLLKVFAPTTRINTIGFWPVAGGRKMLETIAGQSGGEFVFVSDGNSL